MRYYAVKGKPCNLNGKLIEDYIDVDDDKSEAFESAVRMGLLTKEKVEEVKEEVKEVKVEKKTRKRKSK